MFVMMDCNSSMTHVPLTHRHLQFKHKHKQFTHKLFLILGDALLEQWNRIKRLCTMPASASQRVCIALDNGKDCVS